MYKDRRIFVVVPARNEEKLIGRVLETMPEYVDRVIVVDDGSRDETGARVQSFVERDNQRYRLVRHERNRGVGASVATGYREAVAGGADVVAVMAGDAQMPPDELSAILDPVVSGQADYAKANRLFTGEAWNRIPKVRYLGNASLSLLTKVASGYWHVADTQSGFTAITAQAIQRIGVHDLYPRYGYPNHLLVKLNAFGFRALDVPSRPVYGIGEHSGIRLWKVIPTISWLLLRCFLWRMKEKYVIRDFHPLVLFYAASFFLAVAALGLLGRSFWLWFAQNRIPPINTLAGGFCLVSAVQMALFAMWFDMEYDRR